MTQRPITASGATPYCRRRPERTLLYRTVQTHFETWLALRRGEFDDADPVPGYVEREFRRYLECGPRSGAAARGRRCHRVGRSDAAGGQGRADLRREGLPNREQERGLFDHYGRPDHWNAVAAPAPALQGLHHLGAGLRDTHDRDFRPCGFGVSSTVMAAIAWGGIVNSRCSVPASKFHGSDSRTIWDATCNCSTSRSVGRAGLPISIHNRLALACSSSMRSI